MYDFFCEVCIFLFKLFLLVTIILFVIYHLTIATFLGVTSLILIGPWFLSLDSLATVFLEVSQFFVVVIFCYSNRYVHIYIII